MFGDLSSKAVISEKELLLVEEKLGRLEADVCDCEPEHAADFLRLNACVLVCRKHTGR